MDERMKKMLVVYIPDNERRLTKCADEKEKKMLIGKRLSLLTSLLSAMDEKDPFRGVVEILKKETEEKFYQK